MIDGMEQSRKVQADKLRWLDGPDLKGNRNNPLVGEDEVVGLGIHDHNPVMPRPSGEGVADLPKSHAAYELGDFVFIGRWESEACGGNPFLRNHRARLSRWLANHHARLVGNGDALEADVTSEQGDMQGHPPKVIRQAGVLHPNPAFPENRILVKKSRP